MPVKKSIRPKKSTRISRPAFVERAVKFAKSVNLASVVNLKKLTNLTTGMDTAIVLPLVGTVVVVMMIGARTVSQQDADEFTEAAAAEMRAPVPAMAPALVRGRTIGPGPTARPRTSRVS